MSDFPRPRSQARPPRRDGRGGGFHRGGGFRPQGPAGPLGPAVDYRALVEFVARSIADKPEAVDVQAFERGGGTLAIKVTLDDADIGRFVGKGGRHIEAIRTLVRVAALRDRRRIFVDLANPPAGSGGHTSGLATPPEGNPPSPDHQC